MKRFGHGGTAGNARRAGARSFVDALAAAAPTSNMKFGYMIAGGAEALPAGTGALTPGAATLAALSKLGDAMSEPGDVAPDGTPLDPTKDVAKPGDGSIPAGYTYFGQFIDHDITLFDDLSGATSQIDKEDFAPLADLGSVRNVRTPFLELDSVYGAAGMPPAERPPREGMHMLVGPVTKVTVEPPEPFLGVVPGKAKKNDLPRLLRTTDPDFDRTARIGDPRNDENLIVAQLHVALLKAHNTLADLLGSFEAAQERLIKMYQSVIIDDYLPRICDGPTLADILANGPTLYKTADPLYMPIEFAVAGFRFGHSMVRTNYDFNLNFSPFGAEFFFTFSALSGQLGGGVAPETDTFPDNWIIQWERFLPINGSKPQRARPIDTHLTTVLFKLRDVLGNEMTDNIAKHLAKRNLRRGYLVNLPTGQAMAAALGTPPITIDASTCGVPAGDFDPMFSTSTPLWLYVLAEARNNNGKLGVVGTHIVAETLITLARRSSPSIFDSNGNRTMATKHKLSDIINLAALQDTEVAGA